MDVSKMISMVQDLTWTTLSQDIILNYINMVKNDIWTTIITATDEWYNWTFWTTDTVKGQIEYVLSSIASSDDWTLKLKWVSVCYDDTKKYPNWQLIYKKAKEQSMWTLKEDMNYYENYWDYENPIFIVQDNSVFIYPAPKKVVVDWVKVLGIRNIPDYTLTTLEKDIMLRPQYHQYLVQWVIPYVYKRMRLYNEYQIEKQEYEKNKITLTEKLSERTTWPFYATYDTENVN